LSVRRKNPFIVPKLSVEVWKAKTLKLQAMENQEKKFFDIPNFHAKVWSAYILIFSALTSSQSSYGGPREKILLEC